MTADMTAEGDVRIQRLAYRLSVTEWTDGGDQIIRRFNLFGRVVGNSYGWLSSLYKGFPGSFEAAGVQEKYIDIEEDLQAIHNVSICFESVSARLGQERVWEQGVAALCSVLE